MRLVDDDAEDGSVQDDGDEEHQDHDHLKQEVTHTWVKTFRIKLLFFFLTFKIKASGDSRCFW